MTTRPLALSIVLSGILLGFLNYKLKPRLNEKELAQMTQGFANAALWQGQIAPNFDLVTMSGDRFQLSENVGKKVIVLNFFATWCDPCREEMPELNRYYNEHKNESFAIIAIDSDERRELVDGFLDEFKLDFPVGIDSGPIQHQYTVSGFPTTVVIGVDGKIQLYTTGGLANPEVAFDALLKTNRDLLSSGHAISQEDYLRQARLHPALSSKKSSDSAVTFDATSRTDPSTADPSGKDDDGYTLDARGSRIVARMGCPCGCDKTVHNCVCATSKNIKHALATENFHDASDNDIIRGLNNRFCSGPM